MINVFTYAAGYLVRLLVRRFVHSLIDRPSRGGSPRSGRNQKKFEFCNDLSDSQQNSGKNHLSHGQDLNFDPYPRAMMAAPMIVSENRWTNSHAHRAHSVVFLPLDRPLITVLRMRGQFLIGKADGTVSVYDGIARELGHPLAHNDAKDYRSTKLL